MRIISLVLVLAILILLAGCWNSREINELAFVLSIALDKAENGFKVTAQISAEMYSKTTTGSAGTSEKEKPFWVISSNGKTIFEAVRNMAAISPRRIFWSHIKVIIINEELAKNNILEIFDFFSRNPELRLRTWIAITQEAAGRILEIVPLMEKEPSQNIEKIIEKANLSGIAYSIMLKNFLEEYLDPYMEPVASRIVITEVNSRPAIKLEGASVFRSGGLAGWLNEDETRGFLWLKNKISGSVEVVDCPYDGLPVTVEIKKGRTDIESYMSNGVPAFKIKAAAVGKLTEQSCTTEFNNPDAISALENALASVIRKAIESTVYAAQKKFSADVLGFSRELQSAHKKEWRQISSNWPVLFKSAAVDINVKVEIPEVSLLAKPLVPRETASKTPQ